MFVPDLVTIVSEKIALKTSEFVKTKLGKLFLSLVLIGPVTFTPTIYVAWAAPNIDSLRTSTWPLMIIINLSSGVSLAYNGNWQLRLVTAMWALVTSSIWITTLVR